MSFTSVEKNSEGDNVDYSLVARLKPGVSHEQAQADIDRVIAGIQATYPANANVQLHGYFRTLKEETVRDVRPLLNVLLAAVASVLLIACVNLANLLLVRAAGRRREFGVRLALGAARRAVLRQLLTESFLLSLLGGLVGVALAVLLVRSAAVGLPDSLPRLNEIATRWSMFVAAFALVVLTGALCGLAPALACMKTDVLDSLRDGSQSSGEGRSQHRLRGLLVTVEVALATLLLVASGLLLRSFARMLATNPGFHPQHVLTASLALPVHDYPTQQKVDDFYRALQQKLFHSARSQGDQLFFQYSHCRLELRTPHRPRRLCSLTRRRHAHHFQLPRARRLFSGAAYSAHSRALLRCLRRTGWSPPGGHRQPILR